MTALGWAGARIGGVADMLNNGSRQVQSTAGKVGDRIGSGLSMKK
jgi:hypothetical protein